jgi:hypothetical protein
VTPLPSLLESAKPKIRLLAGVKGRSYLICVVEGDDPPQLVGNPPYATYRGTDIVVTNSAWSERHGYPIDYHSPTFRIEVGHIYALVHGLAVATDPSHDEIIKNASGK